MAMRYEDQLLLRRAGFLPWEVNEYATAQAPDQSYQSIDIRSKTWQEAIENRSRWIKSIETQIRLQYGRRATQVDINRLVNHWYKRKIKGEQRNPWDFIKAVYKPIVQISDYQTARTKRSARHTRYLYNKQLKNKQLKSKSQGKPKGKPNG